MKRSLLPWMVSAAILIASLPLSASAACTTHTWHPTTYCDGGHPHQQFKQCSACGTKSYLGTYATKAHGSGATGSGTCPSCGSHSFAGQSCVSGGTCVCGQSGSPNGVHTWHASTYNEGTHPHQQYRQCTKCSAKNYLGTYVTKNHGSGATGSGTCPSCGSHSFAGQNCVSGGTCVCGQSGSPNGVHTWHASTYNEGAHPHEQYRQCTKCPAKNYLGTYVTKNHGSGATGSGTCPECGLPHTWYSYAEGTHPHYNYRICGVCQTKEYTGGTTPKNHGSGTTGSGTCPSCGLPHVYAGQNCVSGGTCVCGQSGSSLGGHNWYNYSEGEHPHYNYRVCGACQTREYTGGTTTKNHGPGTPGSGTCPECGLPHTWYSYAEGTHPHYNYRICGVCQTKEYTGGTTPKNHGPGTPGSGTCPSCGLPHVYAGAISYDNAHPHNGYRGCVCGERQFAGTRTDSACFTCNPIVLRIWQSDESTGGFWNKPTVTYYQEKLNDNLSFAFNGACTYAFPYLAGVTGLTLSNTSNESAADIKIRGGTLAQIKERYPTVNMISGHRGITYPDYNPTPVTTQTVGGKPRSVHIISNATVYIQDRSDLDATEVRTTTTHELCHALGWFDHSTSTAHLMYGAATSANAGIDTLSANERSHLRQFYRLP